MTEHRIYLPPENWYQAQLYQDLFRKLQEIRRGGKQALSISLHPDTYILLFGDLNPEELNWTMIDPAGDLHEAIGEGIYFQNTEILQSEDIEPLTACIFTKPIEK